MQITMRPRLNSLGRSAGARNARGSASGVGSGGSAARAGNEARPPERDGADTFEWRMRASDGPVDLGHYACACGFHFAARVATAVRCPHCGADQAW
jgi:hypothetical protein